jgi:(1->4)-alpha-D-glucan 1-alpha-D-glucosylmutase
VQSGCSLEPNWRQRQPLEIESWADQSGIGDLLAAVCAERGVAVRPAPVLRKTGRAGTGGPCIPRATDRLQLHAAFGFASAEGLVPYLARLGISHCYFSPYLQARPDSMHGYDVIAHDRLNPELGSCEDHDRLCDTLAAHGMGQILDMVPSHVGVMGAENDWWLDLLENGRASRYADFFDINHLAALRMDNAEAFDATHRLVLDLVAEGRIAGLRIDHPDGLYNPAEYFRWVQLRAASRAIHSSAPDNAADRPLYLILEKILVGDEQLPSDWPVHGTTGYDSVALTDDFLVDPRGEALLDLCYRDFAGDVGPLAEVIYRAKRLVMRNLLSSELSRIAESDPHTRDYTLDALRDALAEVVACFPVYRTYISAEGVSRGDRNQVLRAVSEARRRGRIPDLSVLGFVQDVLLINIAEGKPDGYRSRVLRLAMKFQQYTGPVTAKGVEDTGFYRYHRLVSLNEVGGDPRRFGVSIEAFHRANLRRCETWPHVMLAGSTHDNKRSEDVCARLHVLSELPEEWREHVEHWALLHRRFRREIDDGTWPDANAEYLLYQTLLGAWPLDLVEAQLAGDGLNAFRERVIGYMRKAVREAKVHTAWTNDGAEYEAALICFTASILDPRRDGIFFEDFLPFQRRIARLGLFNSLTATLLRLTAPGVPDVYHGSELWSFSLVDPDNRRPVDFSLRQSLLDSMEGPMASGKGRAQLVQEILEHLVHRALELRRANPDLFAHGDYRLLAVQGGHAKRLCAYARSHAGRPVVTGAPRVLSPLVPPESQAADPFADAGWATTFLEVPAATLRDELSGIGLHASPREGAYARCAAEVLRRFPVGLLSSEDPSHA